MSFSDKISWVGGMMGLFTGFSLISGLEILYWLWFKVWKEIMIISTSFAHPFRFCFMTRTRWSQLTPSR